MSDNARFTHITVNAADEDDVVIQAGAVRQAAPQAADEPAPAPEPEPGPVEGDMPDARPQAAPERKPQPAFEEQTLEDLEVGPMSGMQKAVLAGVALVIVCGIVYFTVFMH